FSSFVVTNQDEYFLTEGLNGTKEIRIIQLTLVELR
ncbi:unnamed protein product, partial [marine sediment metagenome]